MFPPPWATQPEAVRVLQLILLTVFLVATVRYGRLAFRLYGHVRRQRLMEQIMKGPPDPEVAARFALLGRWLPTEGVQIDGPDVVVRRAQIEFDYLWERCKLDVQSGRRAFVLALMLTLVATIFGLLPTFFDGPCSDPKVVGFFCVFLGLGPPLYFLSWGLLMSSVLYGAANFFERVLEHRKLGWDILQARRAK